VGCCRPRAYERIFGEGAARRDLRRYRRRGLPRDAREGVAFLRSRGVEGRSVLEVGAGIGAASVELLRAGAGRAIAVELSRGYDAAAAELLAEHGLDGRVERRIGDVVEEPPEPADLVVMNRVVCCYPDVERLVGTAAGLAREALVLSFPPDGPLARAAVASINLLLRLGRQDFRTYIHSHGTILAVAERQGLRLALRRSGPVWQVAAFERFPAPQAGQAKGMDEERQQREPDPAERAEEATEESRRERGDMPIEEQTGLGAGREDDGKPRPF
jgi:magnesium-protoporphyrin O-methyltransferase